MGSIWAKLKEVKKALKTLNTQHYMGVDKKLKYLRDQLKEVQEKMDTNLRQHELIEEEKKAEKPNREEGLYRRKYI